MIVMIVNQSLFIDFFYLSQSGLLLCLLS